MTNEIEILNFNSKINPNSDGYIFSEELINRDIYNLNNDYLQNNLLPFLKKCTQAKSNHMVWYKFSDLLNKPPNFKSNFYLIENRGISRSLANKNFFYKELKLLTEIHKKSSNIGILIPFVRDIKQWKQILEIIKKSGFLGKIGITIDLVSTIFILKELLEYDIANVTINLTNLSIFALGAYDISISKYNNVINYYILDIKKILDKTKVQLNVFGTNSEWDIEICRKFSINNYIHF